MTTDFPNTPTGNLGTANEANRDAANPQGRAGTSAAAASDPRPIRGEGGLNPCESVKFVSVLDPVQREKVLLREKLVQKVWELTPRVGREKALDRTCSLLQDIKREMFGDRASEILLGISARNLRRWCQAYERAGLDGLVEQKLGRSGRKAVEVPAHILDETAAAAIEHGRLGPEGCANVARAYRNVLMVHPDRTAQMAAQLHGGHASKSYVPKSVRDSIRRRVAPATIAGQQGPHALRMAAPFTPGDYSDLPAGRAATGDDMTSNVLAWCPAPVTPRTPHGYVVGQPQVLAYADVGAQKWLVARCILRPSGAYTRDDVWGGVGDVLDQFGLYAEFIFEGGAWRSKKVLGERTGLSENDRFGGLKSLGVILHHSTRPRSKPIEGMFARLQSAMDRCPGYIGREQRYDAPEAMRAAYEACRDGKMHPQQAGILHISAFKEHVERCMAALNAERMDGQIHRGMTPDEKWIADRAGDRLKAIPAEARWMYRSSLSSVTVLRSGMLHITEGTGKYKEDHYYFLPPELHHYAGRTVLVYWNDRHPEADAAVMIREDGRTVRYLGLASYVDPTPRLGATKAQMRDARANERAQAGFVHTQTAVLKPYFLRHEPALPAPSSVVSESVSRDSRADNPVSQIGRELSAAGERATAKETKRAAETAQLRRHGPALAAELLDAGRERAEETPAEPDSPATDFLSEIS